MCECDCGHHDWDDESAVGESAYDVRDRKIHPLPKRKRLVDSAPRPEPGLSAQSGASGWVSEPGSDSDEDDIGDVDERHTRASMSKRAGQDPALDVRTSGEQEYGDGRTAYPPRKRTESPAAHRRLPRRPSGSPPTSASRAAPPHSAGPESPLDYLGAEPVEDDSDGTRSYGFFGEEGYKIARSLSSASSFSTAGLFGGLGLANLHPATGTGAGDRHYAEEEEEEDFEEDGDEDTYGVVDRSRPPVEPTHATTIAATALGPGPSSGSGSNKKKRKIPGIAATSVPAGSSTLPEQPPPSTIPPPQSRTRAREEEPSPSRGDHSHHPSNNEWLPMRAPVNPPTTAKAALAKLRIRPPHVSLCSSCFSTRRHRRKRLKHNGTKQRPLGLPAAPNFVPPAMPREGPPKLPPGSGLKGSKALKAAAKLAKEREKEKERIRKLFAGIKIPNLYDPYDRIQVPMFGVRMLIGSSVKRTLADMRENARKQQQQTHDKSSSSGYPTPPASSDDGEDGHSFPWAWDCYPPTLESFEFRRSAPEAIESRWTHLNEQKDRVKAAKERATKARQEEKERKREKDEREKAEKAAAVAVPPTPVPTPQRKPHAPSPHPLPQPRDVPPSSSTSPPTASRIPPLPSSPPGDSPPAPPPAFALPSPPLAGHSPPLSRKTPLKKGRKKRAAHANAHNVHHRDNYVPSRIPAATTVQTTNHHPQSQSSGDASLGPMSWPASDAAIAAAGPYAATCGGGHYCDPDEWLCLFCEYQLFYGEEPALYRAMRKRKGVLKVRHKAKDRAMKATQGRPGSPPETSKGTVGSNKEVTAGGEGLVAAVAPESPKGA
ncbi:hypothetical protein JCM11491_006050 [Sporobolomyces phaffii]